VLPFRPEAVVFDLDGVLVDSEPTWAEAEAATVEALGGDYTQEISELLYGRGHRDGGRLLAERFGGDAHAIADDLLARALAGIRSGVEPRAGATELVRSLQGRLALAVASNSVREFVEAALAAVALADAFDAVVAGEDAERPKPAPDPYLEACRRLGADPRRSVAIDDSPVGVASAKAAGLYVVGAPSVRDVGLPAADVVVGSLLAISI
jgi:HAD superfamily hydrolase (TIGR01509 family)